MARNRFTPAAINRLSTSCSKWASHPSSRRTWFSSGKLALSNLVAQAPLLILDIFGNDSQPLNPGKACRPLRLPQHHCIPRDDLLGILSFDAKASSSSAASLGRASGSCRSIWTSWHLTLDMTIYVYARGICPVADDLAGTLTPSKTSIIPPQNHSKQNRLKEPAHKLHCASSVGGMMPNAPPPPHMQGIIVCG
eukprot:3262605-Amphidinium_carterae.1